MDVRDASLRAAPAPVVTVLLDTHLGLQRDDLTAGMAVEGAVEAPLVDACIRSALGTGARVFVVPSTKVEDGLGANLRRTGTAPATPGGA